MGSTSYWQAETDSHAPPAPPPSPLAGDVTADVLVIGAGITGTAAALWLAREGARVVVLEGRAVAASASGRNGGFLLGGTADTYAATIARHGRALARRAWAFSVQNQRLAADLLEELAWNGWSCGYQRNGSMLLAANESELEAIWESIRLLLEDGYEAIQLDAGELPSRIRGTYLGGAYHPSDGEVQPAQLVRGLAYLARRSGAIIYEGSTVTGLVEAGAEVVARTPGGTVRAGHAVLATNARLPELLDQVGATWLGARVRPTRGQVLATAPVKEEVFTCPCYADEGYQYWRQLPDGRLVVGGWRNRSFDTEYTDDETPGPPIQDHLERFLRQTLRLAPDVAPVTHRWAGTMAFSDDRLPLVGHVPGSSRCYVSGAYTGHGNANALAAARVVSDLIRGGAHPDADLFDPARLATVTARAPERGM